MFRAFSTRRDRLSYERLGDDASVSVLEAQLKRATSMPAKFFDSGKKLVPKQSFPANSPMKLAKEASKVHPFFSIFQTRRKKRATAKPEFARYVEYLKEGGIWDMNSNVPVIYYKIPKADATNKPIDCLRNDIPVAAGSSPSKFLVFRIHDQLSDIRIGSDCISSS